MKTIHYFNPGHEASVLNRASSYTAPASISGIMKDLATLPSWYAEKEDLIFVDSSFDKSYHQHLIGSGMHIADICTEKKLSKFKEAKVSMWGIAPQAIRVFESLNKKYSSNIILPKWHDEYIHYNSRKYAQEVLTELVTSDKHFQSLEIPLFLNNLESAETHVNKRQIKLLAKAPYSSSGRGLLWIPATGLTRVERQILHGMFRKQGEVSFEPVYQKVIDFAMEFMSDQNGSVSFAGYSLFSTNEKGVYTGNVLLSQLSIIEKLTSHIELSLLEKVKEKLISALSDSCCKLYNGCIGVDMMIYLDEETSKLHPCVEINMRYNMGYLSAMLYEKHISDGAKGEFNIDFATNGQKLNNHLEMEKQHPLVLENDRVKSGYLSLCPINEETNYRAYILIEK